MKLEQFAMERMQSTWENLVEYNLSESGVVPPIRIELRVMPGSAVPRPCAAGKARASAAPRTAMRMDVLRILLRRRAYSRFVSGLESLRRNPAAPRGRTKSTRMSTIP